MDDVGLVTVADVQLMQGLAQRITAVRPGLVARGLYYSVGFREFTRDAPLIKTGG